MCKNKNNNNKSAGLLREKTKIVIVTDIACGGMSESSESHGSGGSISAAAIRHAIIRYPTDRTDHPISLCRVHECCAIEAHSRGVSCLGQALRGRLARLRRARSVMDYHGLCSTPLVLLVFWSDVNYGCDSRECSLSLQRYRSYFFLFFNQIAARVRIGTRLPLPLLVRQSR